MRLRIDQRQLSSASRSAPLATALALHHVVHTERSLLQQPTRKRQEHKPYHSIRTKAQVCPYQAALSVPTLWPRTPSVMWQRINVTPSTLQEKSKSSCSEAKGRPRAEGAFQGALSASNVDAIGPLCATLLCTAAITPQASDMLVSPMYRACTKTH